MAYQPVNIAAGFTDAFRSGQGAWSGLSENIGALLRTKMGEQGQDRRTAASLAQSKENAMLAAGYRPTGGTPGYEQEGLSWEDLLKRGAEVKEKFGPGAQFQMKTKEGHILTFKGEKEDQAAKWVTAMTNAELKSTYGGLTSEELPPGEYQRMYLRNMMLHSKATELAAEKGITIEQAMQQLYGDDFSTKPKDTEKKPSWWAGLPGRAWAGAQNAGINMAIPPLGIFRGAAGMMNRAPVDPYEAEARSRGII